MARINRDATRAELDGRKVRDTVWGHVGRIQTVKTRRNRTVASVVVVWRDGGFAEFVNTDDPSYNRLTELELLP